MMSLKVSIPTGYILLSYACDHSSSQPVFHRAYSVLPFESRAEVALVIVAQLDADVGNRQVGIEEILARHAHPVIEEILEDGGAEFLLEGFLQRAFVGAHHCRQLVERRHFLVAGEDDVLGIVYLVAETDAEGLGIRQETGGHEEARETVDYLRFQILGGLVA